MKPTPPPQKQHPHPKPTPKSGEVRYSPDLALRVCERIATTPQSLARLCEAPDMPGVATIFRWLRDHEDFRAMYLLAKQAQTEILIDEALAIVDDDSHDLIVDDKGRTAVNRAALQRAKMRVAYRQWIASKLLPLKYGKYPVQYQPPLRPPQPPTPPAKPRDPSMWGRRPASPSSPAPSPGTPFSDISDELLTEMMDHPGGAYGWLRQQDEELNRKFASATAKPPAPNQR